MKLFSKAGQTTVPSIAVKYQVIEIEKPRPNVRVDKESRQMVTSLAAHPGFQILLDRLKEQRSLLESKLKSERHTKLEDVEFLQSGIFWTNWLESQLNREVYMQERPQPKPATPEEQSLLERLQADIELVGA